MRSSRAPARSNARSPTCCAAIAEDDEFNQLVLYAGLDTQAVVWLRAWFRYLRQTGSSFGLVTVVDALRRAPNATRALIGLFAAAHDPVARSGRDDAGRQMPRASSTARSRKVRSIDDDRILRRLRALVEAIVRTNAFAPAADGSARVQDQLVAGSRACRRRCRGAKSGSTARASRASTCAAARSPAAASAGPTGATISAPKSSA